MQIEITGQSDGTATTRCPYCHDDVLGGVVCSPCGARYHFECAQTFCLCAALGCPGVISDRVGLTAVPRLPALAGRFRAWQPALDLPKLDLDAWLVTIWPSPAARNSTQAAQVLAEMLGPEYSPYDGRIRLQVSYPEPLLRANSRQQAEEALTRLAAVGIRATLASLRDVLAPIEPFIASGVDPGPPPSVRSADGTAFVLARPWLFVTTSYSEEKSQTTHRPALDGRGYQARHTSVFARRTARPEQAAFVLSPGQRPIFLRSILAVRDGPVRNWLEIVRHLSAGAHVRDLRGVTLSNLLTLTQVGGSGDRASKRDNMACLLLISRLIQLDWEQRSRDGKSGAPKSGDPKSGVAPPKGESKLGLKAALSVGEVDDGVEIAPFESC